MAPASGKGSGGTRVTITGGNLGDGVDITDVSLCDESAAEIVSQSATQVVVVSAPGPFTLGDVCVKSTSHGKTMGFNLFSYNPFITAWAAGQGTISPSGDVEVTYGSNAAFTASAESYYHITSLLTNGAADGAATGRAAYTSRWQNVMADGTVAVSFAENMAPLGTPEWWLARYGWTNDFGWWETNDTDGDRFFAWEERMADTDPTDSGSCFRVTGMNRADSFVVGVACTNTRIYGLGCTTNLIQGAWWPVAGQTGIPGEADGFMELVDPTNAGSRSYRATVEPP
ncbi:MAG: hypothetical protein BWK77_03595 [Verrucomicrobia bacterium A1]|nr:MAG: hypothetical protein BWK77_03595 [Verrucomicrobia bacterium A1]